VTKSEQTKWGRRLGKRGGKGIAIVGKEEKEEWTAKCAFSGHTHPQSAQKKANVRARPVAREKGQEQEASTGRSSYQE